MPDSTALVPVETLTPEVVNGATLPARYSMACDALVAAQDVDECMEWADRAAALASYARQSKDRSLLNMATRIRARAIQRCGEMVVAVPKATNIQNEDGHVLGRTEAARRAGLSEHETRTAVAVASVPKDEFEAQVESDSPPTVTSLAKQGTATRPKPTPRPGFADATAMLMAWRDLARKCDEHDAVVTFGGMDAAERETVREAMLVTREWTGRFEDADG